MEDLVVRGMHTKPFLMVSLLQLVVIVVFSVLNIKAIAGQYSVTMIKRVLTFSEVP